MVSSTEGTSLKILGNKLVLSKKPGGPKKETMTARIIDVGVIHNPPKKPKYIVQYADQHFNINKALRASPDEIKKMSKEHIVARIKKYVLGNLGMSVLPRRYHSEHASIPQAKAALTSLVKEFQAK